MRGLSNNRCPSNTPGRFKEPGIEPEMIKLLGEPPYVAALLTNQIDASAVLVTLPRSLG
jgi:hypothetical protein